MRWITVGPADQPGTSIVLHPPAVDPGITDDERRTIAEMMAKGTYASIILATKDLDGTFERLQASDAEVVQEPTDQPYGDPRLRRPRPRGQPDPHPGAALKPGVDISDTQGIQTVLHPVSDLEKSKAVYTALLGAPPQHDAEYYVGYEAEGQHIGLVPGGGHRA